MNHQIPPSSVDASGFGETVKMFRPNKTKTGAAITVQAVKSRGANPVETVNIEGAYWAAGERAARWEEKTTVQVSRQELPKFAATLTGFSPGMEAKFHGESKNTGYSMDSTTMELSVFSPGRKIAIRLNPDEVFWLTSLVLSQMKCSRPGLSVSDILNLLKLSYSKPRR